MSVAGSPHFAENSLIHKAKAMIELASFDQALNVLKSRLKALGNPPIHFIGQRGTDSHALLSVLKLIGYPLDTVMCLNDSPEHSQLNARRIISLERTIQCRDTWYSDGLSQIFEQMNPDLPSGSLVFAYTNFPALESYCQSRKIRILSENCTIQRLLQNKLFLLDLLSRSDLPLMPQLFCPLRDTGLKKCREFLGTGKLVFQHIYGNSGSGTFFIDNETDLNRLKKRFPSQAIFKISPFLNAFTFSVTGCVTDSAIVWAPPAVQIIGDDVSGVLSPRPAIFSGSDFFPNEELTEHHISADIFQKFGAALDSVNYRGIFNLDIFSNENFIIDLNARCPGSIRIITELEIENNQIPLVLLQMLHFLDIGFKVTKPRHHFTKNASFLVMHSLERQPVVLTKAPLPGIYGMKNNEIARLESVGRLANLKDGQFMITGGVPSGEVEIREEAPLGRIWFGERIVDGDMNIQPDILGVAGKIYGLFGFAPSDGCSPPKEMDDR